MEKISVRRKAQNMTLNAIQKKIATCTPGKERAALRRSLRESGLLGPPKKGG